MSNVISYSLQTFAYVPIDNVTYFIETLETSLTGLGNNRENLGEFPSSLQKLQYGRRLPSFNLVEIEYESAAVGRTSLEYPVLAAFALRALGMPSMKNQYFQTAPMQTFMPLPLGSIGSSAAT